SLGVAAYLVPALFFAAGLAMLVHENFVWRWKLLWAFIFLISSACLLHLQAWLMDWSRAINAPSPGGFMGQWLDDYIFQVALGVVGAKIVLWTVYVLSLVFLFELHPRVAWTTLSKWWKEWRERRRQARIGDDPIAQKMAEREDLDRKRRQLERELARMAKKGDVPAEEIQSMPEASVQPEVIDASRPTRRKSKAKAQGAESSSGGGTAIAEAEPPQTTTKRKARSVRPCHQRRCQVRQVNAF
ncbi:MAG: DNA translocase FtsK 4TM domain-containing protein, partial [Bacteroidota bacterium]